MATMNEYLVKDMPPKVYYVQNFLTEVEEGEILKHVYAVPKPKWTCLSNRKLQNWGGIPHVKGMIAEDIPQWLTSYMKKVSINIFPKDKLPNHVLVNEYLAEQGIMAHLDGPLFYPTICTLTCGSHTILHFHPKADSNVEVHANDKAVLTSLLLERRSLVVIQEDLYHLYPHSIEEKKVDVINDKIANLNLCSTNYEIGEELMRNTRISLTIRHVPQTAKFKIKLSR